MASGAFRANSKWLRLRQLLYHQDAKNGNGGSHGVTKDKSDGLAVTLFLLCKFGTRHLTAQLRQNILTQL